ncbi:MAG: class I SAM-dependent methyltransferase [Lentisphaerae bacterium]|nr:class I SAM-dependent methyltransferase [Lentisphaerota bacterium]
MPQEREPNAAGWAPFERLAERYDAWFDGERGRRIFRVEADCIRGLLKDMPRPWLEIGVGTGRFAAELGMDEGIDPSSAVLKYAAGRGIATRIGRAEELPFSGGRFGVVMLVVTICFLDNPGLALGECRRVLRSDGHAVVGLVPRDSAWGKMYARKGAEGHPFYSAAKFYTAREIVKLAERAGFRLNQAASCLFEEPGLEVDRYQRPREGVVADAGFVGLRFGIDRNGGKLEKGE